ncbi:tetraacyldisaccharide 4'-kinase [Rhodocyclus tenuis]|uniref:tetraacyldisaccharide 4'-kinase n=1 Tax=Rhodocyclus gracilis TaxID=2929842 RepID=UPI001298DA0B|nr:tetraacyldisaccharide 4'-kinase [Rhodocyclus gracilis]MRD73651.1 tetraacyldisaccharide 4'-kinase [Rhodocyclus gracilis]
MALSLVQRLPRWWYQRQPAPALLPFLPVTWLFQRLVARRRAQFLAGRRVSVRLPVPVVVVGNLTVGGSGKTPVTLWLVEQLRQAGWHPGVVSRGYGGRAAGVRAASADDATATGDEPALLVRRSGVPVFVGQDRVAAAQALLAANPECDVLVADDGMQHYRLRRDVEIAVFDSRGAGNGRMLPVGPLREPLSRLNECTAVVWNGAPEPLAARAACGLPQFAMTLTGSTFRALADPARHCAAADLAALCGGRPLYALAGIGDPQRFFRHLEVLGLVFAPRAFPDHHLYSPADLAFARDGVLLMTEKDAVKCAALLPAAAPAVTGHASSALPESWVLPVDADITSAPGAPGLLDLILEKFNGRPPA